MIQAESPDRGLRSIRLQTRAARSPIDLAGLGFKQSKVQRRQIEQLATLVFADDAENIVLRGGTNTGKTPLATALGVAAITRHDKRARFFSSAEVVNAPDQE